MESGPLDRRGLTRRSVLLGTAGMLLAPAASRAELDAAARARLRRASSEGSVLRRWAGTLGRSPRRFPVPAGHPLVGVSWIAPAGPQLWLRASLPGGGWGPWVAAGSAGHGPGRFGEPLWLGEAGEIELRAGQSVRGARLHFVAPSGADPRPSVAAATAGSPPLAQPILTTAGGQPPIIARGAWAGDGYLPRFSPSLGTVRLGFVHHTENPNGYSAAQVPALLRAIFVYHHDVRGWSDIGYNFVIDLFGRVWEARYGGIDLAVVGAQAGGYNAFSTGVAVLGSFGGSPPSRAAMTSLERLLAWKLSLHGVPVAGRVTVEVDPAAAWETPYPRGARVSLPRIAGHRDGDSTNCPGDALYARLPAVRTATRQRVGTEMAALTLQAPVATLVAQDPFALAGRLCDPQGKGLAGQTVVLQDVGDVPRRTLSELVTDPSGRWATTMSLTENLIVRALRTGPPAAVSDAAFLYVAPKLSLAVESQQPLVIGGQVTPAKGHVTVRILVRGRVVETHRVRVSHGLFTVTPQHSAPLTALASSDEDDWNAAGSSPPLVLSG